MKIYTRTGDKGQTSLYSGQRVSKAHLRVETYGTVDELNSHLGVVRSSQPAPALAEQIETIQNHLFRVGADLATPLNTKADWLVRIDQPAIDWLEGGIDTMTEALPPLKVFILPGGAPAAAHLHVARTVCRRAERLIVALSEHEALGDYVAVYMNRLSDWLFTAARYENHQAGIQDERWQVQS